MEDFKDSELASMERLYKDIVLKMHEAVEGGMDVEHSVHVLGSLAVTFMNKLPDTDDAAAVLQNFMAQVAELLGEPETATRH